MTLESLWRERGPRSLLLHPWQIAVSPQGATYDVHSVGIGGWTLSTVERKVLWMGPKLNSKRGGCYKEKNIADN